MRFSIISTYFFPPVPTAHDALNELVSAWKTVYTLLDGNDTAVIKLGTRFKPVSRKLQLYELVTNGTSARWLRTRN
jgi:hypothetical protein